MPRADFAVAIVLAFTLGLLEGCATPREGAPESDLLATAPTSTAAPTLDELRNATYGGFQGLSDSVTLANGRWEGALYRDDSPMRPMVSYVRELRLAGDLDGDGSQEAVGFVAYSGGGTGQFYHLAVVERGPSGAHSVALAPIGDRVQFRSARLEDRRIVLDLVQGGERDAACCPGDLVSRMWQLRGDSLVEGEPRGAPGRLSLETIGGDEWVLTHWDLEEPVAPEIEITLRHDGGKLGGRAACNRYSAAASMGAQPGDLSLGPAVSTKMACPEPAMSAERRFLEQLAGSNRFSFFAGELALTYRTGSTFGTMLFARAREGSAP